MEEIINRNTEPAVVPKPKPKTTPKPKPRRGDPWTVPAPKVNPTPKAYEKKMLKYHMMSKVDGNNKMMINTVDELNMMKKLMKKDAFFAKFEVSMDVVSNLAAVDAIVYDSITDVAMTATQKQMLLKGEF